MTTRYPMLSVHSLIKVFGGLQALSRVSFEVPRGSVTALIGPNGAGKTTCLNVISGIHAPTSGRVTLAGQAVTGLGPHRLAQRGLARTFQNLQVFQNMTVLENVMVGLHVRGTAGFWASMIRTPKVRREERITREKAAAMLDFFGLAHLADTEGTGLSYGDQKKVEMARALVSGPALVLLDEPVAGLNTRETMEIADRIKAVRDQGITVLLVEHDMDLVMGISDEVLVLSYGELIASGPPAEVQRDPCVIAAYLGSDGCLDA